MKPTYISPKGTSDILPEEYRLREYIFSVMRSACEKFGFEPISTPTFESTSLFKRGVGEGTDIVSKEMFSFTRSGEDSFSLKPEGTAPVIRAYIQNGMASLTQPVKLYYITNCFRAENPQKGRLREFTQLGAEVIGSESAYADAAVIALADYVLKSLNITGVKLKLNTVGCPSCRSEYYAALKNYVTDNNLKLCENCRERLNKNPMRILDCKNEHCKEQLLNAPLMSDYLCNECSEHFDSLKTALDAYGIVYEVDPKIVRGLDYYTNTAFEFISDSLGAQSTVCGGGRYNGLCELLGGEPTPGVGFGMGIERLVIILNEKGIIPKANTATDIYLASMGGEAANTAAKISVELRNRGLKTATDLIGRSLKAQMKYADKLNASFVYIIGDDELNKQAGVLRDMATKEQIEIPFAQIANELCDKLHIK